MITVSRRSATPRDIRALAKGKGSLSGNILTTTLPFSAVLAGMTWLASGSALIGALVGSLLFVPSTISNVRFFADVQKRRDSLGKDLEVIDVCANQVVEVGHFGSDGPAWVFMAEDGQALLLVGQWLLEQRKFPSLEFAVYSWVDTRAPLRVRSKGKKIRPVESLVCFESGYRMGQIEISLRVS